MMLTINNGLTESPTYKHPTYNQSITVHPISSFNDVAILIYNIAILINISTPSRSGRIKRHCDLPHQRNKAEYVEQHPHIL